MIAINCKTYLSSTGKQAVALASICTQLGKDIILIVPALDLAAAAAQYSAVFVEHADSDQPGQSTGAITLEGVKAAGGKGVLLSHAEKQLSEQAIARTITRCKQLGLKTLLCANTVAKAKQLAKYAPDYLAIEPPELIGGKISVSTAKPDIVKKSARILPGKVLVGAGIHSKEDVLLARTYGAAGVLLSSYVALAKDKKKAIMSLL
jgi:triosephosphate isomerase